MRFFNTTGPVVAADHYCIPPLDRPDLDDLLRLVRDKRYFVLHAPRQTGKTSALLALRDRLNAGGYRCIYANVEVGQTAREDVGQAMRTVLGRLASQARMTLGDEFLDGVFRDLLARYAPHDVLLEALTRWAETDATPLVLLIDEIDMLIGDSLLAVLRQLRTGYHQRPRSFPQSVVLCGVRDVRDYRIHSGSANAIIAGRSAFNVKAKSLRLGDFSRDEVLALLGQHTAETGQAFAAEALELVWGADPGAAVAGERARRGGLFRGQGGPGPVAAHRRGGPPGGAGTDHPAAGDAPGPVGGQAEGGPGAAGGRAAAERGGGADLHRPRPGVHPGPRPPRSGSAVAHCESHLRGGGAARADLVWCRRSSTRRRRGTSTLAAG